MEPYDPTYIKIIKRLGMTSPNKQAEMLLEEIVSLRETIGANAKYLLTQIQTPQGKYTTPGAHVIDYLATVAEGVVKMPVVFWTTGMWHTASESTEGFVGEVLTEEMFQEITPQIWFWDNDWGAIQHPSNRHPDRPEITTFMVARIVKPLVVQRINHPACNGVATMDIHYGLPEEPDKPGDVIDFTYNETLPFITMTLSLVGEPLQSGDPYMHQFFLRQKVVSREPLKLDRAGLRRAERAKQDVSRVKTVVLRRLVRKETKDESGREYTHQWVVSGHTRKQWYPSTQTHKYIFIEPYLKGPEDAPMLPFRGTIYRAKR